MGVSWTLRELDEQADRAAVANLWQAALAPTWPLLPRGLDLFRRGFVAVEPGDRFVGAVAVDPAGSVPALMVAPGWRRQGVATVLLAAAERRLRDLGRAEVRAGSGGGEYIWPGVPEDLPAAAPLLASRGWQLEHRTIDLTRDLVDYRPPSGVYDRARRAAVTITTASAADQDDVVAFEAATFPSWLTAFQRWTSDALVARDAAGRIVGTLLYAGPDADLTLRPMLGPACGAIGCVGVAPDAQGLGIGTAMVAQASELLHERGTRLCHIGWVVREAFYTRVGYRPWRGYLMYRKALA